jgi:hypothetical protein
MLTYGSEYQLLNQREKVVEIIRYQVVKMFGRLTGTGCKMRVTTDIKGNSVQRIESEGVKYINK